VSESSEPHPGAVALSVLDGIGEGVVVLDRAWVCRYVNDAGAALLDTTVGQLLGKSYRELYPQARGSVVEQAVSRVMCTGQPESLDDRCRLGDRWLRNRVLPWDGGIVIFCSDVTAERDAEHRLADALRASAETVAMLETLQRSAPVGFAFVDREHRFVRVNQAMAVLNGLSAEEHVGRTVASVLPAVWPQLEPIYHRVLRDGESVTDLEMSGERGAGPGECRVWVASYYPVIPEGSSEPIGLGVVAHDVTGQRRLEAQLRQAQKMEAVGQLAGGIAHDFNNVLAAVTLNAELSLQRAPEGYLRDSLTRILATTRSAVGLTNQLLVFSRQQRVPAAPVDLASAIAGLHPSLATTLGDGIELTIDVSDVPRVLIAPGQLDQILLNLAGNGRDAMPAGGQFAISATVLDVTDGDLVGGVVAAELRAGGLRAGRYVDLRVIDTGVGMTPDVLDRATEPFFTTKADHGGAGLGLATVYGIVRAAGGAFTLRSEAGRGTVAGVLLPAVDQPAPAPVPAPPQPVTRAGQRVLVVEDQEELRRLVVAVLEGAGYDVSDAQAEDVLKDLDDAVPVDLLVTDVVMPGISGPQLADTITTTWPGTRVLFISGYTGGMLRSHGLSDTDVPLLVKPFTAAQLLDSVAEALTG
jgi:PAS domain S-box-containing protein